MSEIPTQTFADCLQQPRAGRIQRWRLSQDARGLILHRQTPFEPLAIGDVADNAGEEMLAALDELAKGQFEGQLGAIFVQTGKFNGFPAHVALARRHVTLQTGAMHVPEIIGHQHRQGLTRQFITRVTKHFFGGAVGKQNRAVLVDRDDAVRGSLSDDSRDLSQTCKCIVGAHFLETSAGES